MEKATLAAVVTTGWGDGRRPERRRRGAAATDNNGVAVAARPPRGRAREGGGPGCGYRGVAGGRACGEGDAAVDREVGALHVAGGWRPGLEAEVGGDRGAHEPEVDVVAGPERRYGRGAVGSATGRRIGCHPPGRGGRRRATGRDRYLFAGGGVQHGDAVRRGDHPRDPGAGLTDNQTLFRRQLDPEDVGLVTQPEPTERVEASQRGAFAADGPLGGVQVADKFAVLVEADDAGGVVDGDGLADAGDPGPVGGGTGGGVERDPHLFAARGATQRGDGDDARRTPVVGLGGVRRHGFGVHAHERDVGGVGVDVFDVAGEDGGHPYPPVRLVDGGFDNLADNRDRYNVSRGHQGISPMLQHLL